MLLSLVLKLVKLKDKAFVNGVIRQKRTVIVKRLKRRDFNSHRITNFKLQMAIIGREVGVETRSPFRLKW